MNMVRKHASLIATIAGVLSLVGWLYYVSSSPVDHDLHRQCPDPSGEYYDCDWWPRRK